MDDEDWRGFLPPSVTSATGTVFHYTSPPTLLGACAFDELWATEAAGMNDVAEVRQGWNFIESWLRSKPNSPVIEQLRRVVDGVDISKAVKTTFMLCASTECDDANQWRLYANSGRGYVIGLESSKPLRVRAAKATNGSPGRKIFGTRVGDLATVTPWLHVLYDDVDKQEVLDDFAIRAEAEWSPLEKAHASPEGEGAEQAAEDAYDNYIDTLATGLSTIAQLMKSRGFVGENEVRIIVTLRFPLEHEHFRATDYGIVRFVKLISWDGRGRDGQVLRIETPYVLPISEVGLGPLLSVQSNRDSVADLLKRSGYPNASIWSSSVPLR